MTDTNSVSSTRTARVINASADTLYRAFIDPAALEIWLAPDGMSGKVHEFDACIGGGYRMSLSIIRRNQQTAARQRPTKIDSPLGSSNSLRPSESCKR